MDLDSAFPQEQSTLGWDNTELEDLFPPQDILETDWFIVANQLRQQNQELIKTTVCLEETIAKKQQLLQETQEKILILTKELIASQNNIAQLEQELLLQEEIYQNKNQQLLRFEKQVKELETRLYRQQQSTLHYKAALKNNNVDSPIISTTIQPWNDFLEIKKENKLLEHNQVNLSSQPLEKRNIDLPSFLV